MVRPYFQNDIREAEELTASNVSKEPKLKETKSAKALSKRVEKLIAKMDNLVQKLVFQNVLKVFLIDFLKMKRYLKADAAFSQK